MRLATAMRLLPCAALLAEAQAAGADNVHVNPGITRRPAEAPSPRWAASVRTPSGGIGTPLLIAGVAVAVLVGGLGGLALRRRLA